MGSLKQRDRGLQADVQLRGKIIPKVQLRAIPIIGLTDRLLDQEFKTAIVVCITFVKSQLGDDTGKTRAASVKPRLVLLTNTIVKGQRCRRR